MKKGSVIIPSDKIEDDSPCLCLPTWLSQLITHEGCSFCGKKLDSIVFAGTILIPCGNGAEVVHLIGLEFHEECSSAWQRSFGSKARSKLCDYVPFSAFKLRFEQKEFTQQLVISCVKTHVFTDQNCGGCKARGQTHVRFDLECDQCHRVRYCDQGCKDAHRARHKVICENL